MSSPIPPGLIDVAAALAALADDDPSAPAEPRAWDLLTTIAARRRLSNALDRIRRKTPRPCHCCGAMFVGRAVSAVTCDTCRRAGRKRCKCGQVFRSTGRGPRKCARCRQEVRR